MDFFPIRSHPISFPNRLSNTSVPISSFSSLVIVTFCARLCLSSCTVCERSIALDADCIMILVLNPTLLSLYYHRTTALLKNMLQFWHPTTMPINHSAQRESLSLSLSLSLSNSLSLSHSQAEISLRAKRTSFQLATNPRVFSLKFTSRTMNAILTDNSLWSFTHGNAK